MVFSRYSAFILLILFFVRAHRFDNVTEIGNTIFKPHDGSVIRNLSRRDDNRHCIVVFGDVNGNVKNLKKMLHVTGTIEGNRDRWTGHVNILVFLGNTRPYPNDLKVYKMIEKLRLKAKKSGGNVHTLFGVGEYENIKGKLGRKLKKKIRRRWISGYDMAARISLRSKDLGNEDHGATYYPPVISFLHRGLDEYVAPFPSHINQMGRTWLGNLLGSHQVNEQFWPWNSHDEWSNKTCTEVLEKTGSTKMIVAGTGNEVTKECNDALIMVPSLSSALKITFTRTIESGTMKEEELVEAVEDGKIQQITKREIQWPQYTKEPRFKW